MELKWVWFITIRIAMMSVLLVLGDACLEQERLALLQLKPFFNHYDELVDWDEAVNGTDCCRWKGIECNTTDQRLIALTLNSTRYRDEGWYLNASLFLPFVELKRLYLQENAIAGCIQNEGFEKLSSKLRNLEILDLSRNYLNDSIVLSLSQLSSLRYLSLAYNRLEGSTQTNGFQWLSRLGNLETLDLTRNYLEKNIFFHISGLSSLKTLSLSGNFLAGQLLHIQELNNLTKLKNLDLSLNSLESISNQDETQLKLTKLEQLDLSGNHFRNNTISFLKGLSSLKSLDMSSNDLQGSLDIKDLSRLTNLKKLDLSWNRIESLESSKDLDAFSSLKELYLGRNQLKLDVAVYKGVCDLKNLQVLDLSWNAFEGMLPHCLGDLASLRELDVSNNHFSGNLTPLVNLTSLEYLSLSKNHFQIPMSFLEHFPNLQGLWIDEIKMVMEPSFQVHTSVSKLQLRFISVSNCLTSAELHLQLLTFLYYQYDLRYVDLSGNNLSGTFPNWLLQNNTNLEYLILNGNSFSGPLSLPSDSAPNWNVSLVDISDNNLQGQIPSNICATFPHLVGLFLFKNDFEGNIQPCLSGMKYLSLLDLSNNRLSGRLPEELITKDRLLILRLSNNDLYGNVSPAILKANGLLKLYLDGNNFALEMTNIDVSASEFPTSLWELDLSHNNLYGKLPRWIGNVSSLTILVLSNNNFDGSIPTEFCNLNRLEFLDLSQNTLSGSIPSCFNPPYIEHIRLHGNSLSGPLSPAFSKISSLVTLDLSENNLSGSIPEWIGTLSSLSVLLLKDNHLDGEIPVQLCKLSSLSILDLSQNILSGPIHSCLGNLTLPMQQNKALGQSYWFISVGESANLGLLKLANIPHIDGNYIEEWIEFTTKSVSLSYGGNILKNMTGINLSGNKLTGQISPELGNLSQIHSLNLSHNNLVGVIPSSFSKLKQLESLDLSYNNLSGEIPNQLVDLNFLEVFSVAHNNLSGRIPEPKAQFGTFSESSYEGNPFLCGSMLHKSCSKTDSPSTTSSASNEEEDSLVDMYVLHVSFLVSYAVMFLATLSVLYMNQHWRRLWFSFFDKCITACRYSTVGNFLGYYIYRFRRCV